jgi:hypothetical protein
MSNRTQSYLYLIEEFTEEKLEERFLFLYECAKIFIRDYEVSQYVDFSIKALKDVVIDYFSDIKRLKDFHNLNRVNIYKIAGYTAYWIYKRKPLYLKKEPSSEDIVRQPYLDDINEWFSSFMLLYIIYDRRQPILRDDRTVEHYINLINQLNYFLVYRQVTQYSLELIAFALDTLPAQQKNSHGTAPIAPE